MVYLTNWLIIMLSVSFKVIILALLFAVTGCSALPLNGMLNADDEQGDDINKEALLTIQQLIETQPGENKLTLQFDGHSDSLKSNHIRAISQWIVKPVESVEVKVGPVRHQDLISAINISRQRGKKVVRVLNTFKIPASVTYDPSLAVNTIEVSGWL